MGEIHDDLREVMGLLGKATQDWRAYPYGAIRSGQFHEYVNGSAQLQNAMFTGEFRDEDRDAALAAVNFLRQHGPALLARQEGEDWLPIESAPRDGSVIDLFGRERLASCFWDSVSKEWRQYYSEAIPCSFSISDETPTHWRRLPTAPAARSGGGGSVVKFSDTDGWDYEIHQDPIP